MSGFVVLIVLAVIAGLLVTTYFVFRNRETLKDRYVMYTHHKKLYAGYTACGLASPGQWPLVAYEDWAKVDCPECKRSRRGTHA